MTDDHEPDGMEKGIRFGCGFLFGAVWGVWASLTWLADATNWWIASAAVIAIVCGLLAMRFGDRFWEWVAKRGWLRWLFGY